MENFYILWSVSNWCRFVVIVYSLLHVGMYQDISLAFFIKASYAQYSHSMADSHYKIILFEVVL